jgi:hypothetical protein
MPAISVSFHCYCKKDFFLFKITETLASGIQLWKFYFQPRGRCALTSAFDKIAGTKKIAGKCFFLQSNAFFAGKCFFCRQRFSLKKIANDENLSSYLSQGDGGLKKNNPYLIKLVRE